MRNLKSFKEIYFLKNPQRLKLIQFWSTWCGSCVETKHLKDFCKFNSNVEVYRLNVEENQLYAEKYSVVIVQTYIFFKNLKPVLTLIGKQTKRDLERIFL